MLRLRHSSPALRSSSASISGGSTTSSRPLRVFVVVLGIIRILNGFNPYCQTDFFRIDPQLALQLSVTSRRRYGCDVPPWGSTFHSRLRWAREAAGLNGRELAERIGSLGGSATQSRVSEWERGTVPRPTTQAHIAHALSQPVAWLRSGEGEPTRPDDAPATTASGPLAKALLAGRAPATRDEIADLEARVATIEKWMAAVDAERGAAVDAIERIADEAEADD